MSPRRSSSSKNNEGSDVPVSSDSRHNMTSSSEKSILNHNRRMSRPFDVLYQSYTHSQKSPDSKCLDQDFENYKTASYIQIEEAIRSGKNVANAASSPVSVPPVVTCVESPTPRRTRSLICDSPTLRRRNTFKNRNKMQKRPASPQKDDSSSSVFSGSSKLKKSRKKASKLSFVFPIKRRTSYKYFPASRALPKESKFTSQQDIDDYFVNDNIFALMKDVIPRTMAVFEYKHLTNMFPKLTSHPHRVAISRDAKVTVLEREPGAAASDKVPLQGEKLVESESSEGTHNHDTASSENSLLAKRRTFLNAVYAKYRDAVLAEGGKLPQKVEDAFPFEGEMMTDEEKEKMNTQILLEILLRRTVAAKIDFRLKRSGVTLPKKRRDKPRSPRSPSTNTSDSSSFEGSNKKQRHIENKRHSSYQVGMPNKNASSTNTDELMQQDASVLSELLPSPQISFTSNILAMGVSPTNTRNAHIRSVSNDDKYNSETRIPHLSLDHVKLQDWEFQGRGSSIGSRGNEYIYDVRKFDAFSRETPKLMSSPLGNVNNTSLRPLKGSNHTLSSYSLHSVENLGIFDPTLSSSIYAQQERSSNSTGDTTRCAENNSFDSAADYRSQFPNGLVSPIRF